ncbi:hypothetical protein [Paenibacillus ehimensis]|uniref:hypothetical protein n=1 Tax=Paenibacillus ehimensis TaxID=79264 RepID=UPI00126816C7|nr:hypothetical protein [Paenibacillus ehimensis]
MVRSSLLGVFWGLTVAGILSLIISILGNLLAGGLSFGGWWWFFLTLAVPACVSLGLAGYYRAFEGSGRLKLWLYCISSGFLNVLFMGTIGAITASSLMYGYEGVNVSGYLEWGPIYAALFLPVSTIVMLILILVLRKIIKSTNALN